MKIYLYTELLNEKFLYFSLNREFRRYIKNPNDPAAKARWNYVLTKNNNNFMKGGSIRHNNNGSIRLRSSDEEMNDFLFRLDQAKQLANNHAAKVNKNRGGVSKFDPNIVNIIDRVKYVDKYGNNVNAHLNQSKSYTTINSNPIDMYLSNPLHKYHEDDGHLNPNLRYYKLQNPASKVAVLKNRSHDTQELQRLDAAADLYGIQAYNEWCKLKEMPSTFEWTTDKMIQDRNKILYKQKCGQVDELKNSQNNPKKYHQTQERIMNGLPIDQRNPFDYQQYMKSDESQQLENTEPELYR
ncbi:MAG: hypothetical protein IKN25_05435, partial [Spirochaetales bacterium]|nr:hypothetical protein [Spirochaetales bacterium]